MSRSAVSRKEPLPVSTHVYENRRHFSCVAYRRKQLIGYSAGVLLLLLVLCGDYGLLTLTAYNSTTVTPRPTVTTEHSECESIGTICLLLR